MAFARKGTKKKKPLGEAELYTYAVKALGRQMRTEVELRRLMSARAEAGERGQATVKAVIARLKERRYLDDQSYAETFVRLRQENEKLGARRMADWYVYRLDEKALGRVPRTLQRGAVRPQKSLR